MYNWSNLKLIVNNEEIKVGRMTKRKKAFKGLELVVNEPMGFMFRDAMKDAARRKAKQANAAATRNGQIANSLTRK